MDRKADQARSRADETGTIRQRIDSTEAALIGAYHPVRYAFVQFFTEHLSDCAQAFDQDLGQRLDRKRPGAWLVRSRVLGPRPRPHRVIGG